MDTVVRPSDGDTGWGGTVNVWHTHSEDQLLNPCTISTGSLFSDLKALQICILVMWKGRSEVERVEPEPATGALHGAPLPPLRPPHYLSPSTCQKVEEGFVLGRCHPAYDPLHSRSGHECLTSVCVHCFFFVLQPTQRLLMHQCTRPYTPGLRCNYCKHTLISYCTWSLIHLLISTFF